MGWLEGSTYVNVKTTLSIIFVYWPLQEMFQHFLSEVHFYVRFEQYGQFYL